MRLLSFAPPLDIPTSPPQLDLPPSASSLAENEKVATMSPLALGAFASFTNASRKKWRPHCRSTAQQMEVSDSGFLLPGLRDIIMSECNSVVVIHGLECEQTINASEA